MLCLVSKTGINAAAYSNVTICQAPDGFKPMAGISWRDAFTVFIQGNDEFPASAHAFDRGAGIGFNTFGHVLSNAQVSGAITYFCA